MVTDAGRRLRQDFVAALFTGVPAVAGLSDGQRHQLRDLLVHVTAAVDADDDGPSTPGAAKSAEVVCGGPQIRTAAD